MTLDHTSLAYAFAGIAFFMLGLTLASESLEKLASNKIRDLLSKVNDRPSLGVLAGILMTAILQSSGAVTSMLVGLSSAGVMNLKQVMSLIIGTAIGTTIAVQILSLNIAQYGLPVFTIAFFIYFLSNKKAVKSFMSVGMGFGLIFWGLEVIGMGTGELKQLTAFQEVLMNFKESPLLTILVTALFTAIVHSSAVVIGFAMTLAMSGDLGLVDAIYWVYGANIGTTATALFASLGSNYLGRQVALSHFFFKVIGVLIFYGFTQTWASWVPGATSMREVANSHTLFNVATGLMFFPFINLGVKLIEKLIPPDKKDFGVKFLSRKNFENPSVAMAHAQREAMRMADIVVTMVRDSLDLFKRDSEELVESIKKRDNRVDMLHREIHMFLSQFSESGDPIPSDMYRLLSFVTDMESIGDVIDNSLLEMSQKMHNLKTDFSQEGWEDLESIYKTTLECIQLSVSAFLLKDTEVGSKVIYLKREIRKIEKRLRQKHIQRLVEQDKKTINTSSIHFDVLSEYRRVSGLATNHVYGLLKESDQYNILPRRES